MDGPPPSVPGASAQNADPGGEHAEPNQTDRDAVGGAHQAGVGRVVLPIRIAHREKLGQRERHHPDHGRPSAPARKATLAECARHRQRHEGEYESEVVHEERALSDLEAGPCERIADQLVGHPGKPEEHHERAQGTQQAGGEADEAGPGQESRRHGSPLLERVTSGHH